MAGKKDKRPIIIKKVKKHGHGHHGGAWKVAYADFVTAMMAFFLLMWLLNATTEEQRRGISNYFGPVGMVSGQAGSGGILKGKTLAAEGEFEDSAAAPAVVSTSIPEEVQGDGDQDATSDEAAEEYEEAVMKQIEETLKKEIETFAMEENLKNNIIIEITPEGLRIQLIDQDKKSMFPLGSEKMHAHTTQLLQKVAHVIQNMPNKLSISGHTDSKPYVNSKSYSNWELSAARANASRKVLMEAGIPSSRVEKVVGKADNDHFVPETPTSPQNRRISIVLHRTTLKKDAA